MAKKTSSNKKALPKGNTSTENIQVRDSNDSSVKGLSAAIALAMIPVMRSANKTLVDSLGLMQSYLLSELPDLGLIGGYLGDFVDDLMGNNKEQVKQTKAVDEQAKDIKIIKKENIGHTNIFDLVYHELDDISNIMRDLLKATSDVWGINEDQLAVIKDSNRLAKEAEKSAKFNLQKAKADNTFSLKDHVIAEVKGDSKNPLWKMLENVMFMRFIPLLEGALIGLFEILLGNKIIGGILSKIAPKLFEKISPKVAGKIGNIFKAGEKFAVGEGGKLSSSFGKVAKEIPKVSKFTKVMKAVPGVLGTVGKVAMKGAGILTVGAAAIAGAQGAYNAYDEGKRGAALIEATFKNIVDELLSPLNDLIGTDIFSYDKITDQIGILVYRIWDGWGNIFNDIGDFFNDTVKTITDKITSLKDSIVNGFLDTIRSALQKFIPEDNKINILGYEMKFAPDSLHDFAYPNQKAPDVQPSAKQDQRTVDMMSNQSKIEQASMNTGGPREPSSFNNTVANISPVNNTYMSMPIVTRNPDPIFGNYLSF